jgi:hypothetical protein
MPGILGFYATWYPPLWLKGVTGRFAYGDWGKLAPHMRFVERSCRKLARESFHGMAVYQAKMERKQAFLFRCVDVVMELFTMVATMSHARTLKDKNKPNAEEAIMLADLHCRNARRKVQQSFKALWSNDDNTKNKVAASVMKGDQAWLQAGIMGLGLTQEQFRTHAITGADRQEEPKRAAVGA